MKRKKWNRAFAACFLTGAVLMEGGWMIAEGAIRPPYKLALPGGYVSPFVDVTKEDWFYNYVGVLNSQGIIDGYGNGEFGPNDPLTAGAAFIMVLKAAGHSLHPGSEGDDHWAQAYADYILERDYLPQEVVSHLDEPIARIHIAQLTAKALGLGPSNSQSPFLDTEDGYVTALYENGIITGTKEEDDFLFLPDQEITRGEISAIVWQIDRFQQFGRQIPFQGAYYHILDGVPVNQYKPEGFRRDQNRYMIYEEEGVETTFGVDVSVHQGEIDWQKVAQAGVDFAMLRVGYRGYGPEGNMRGDTTFDYNIHEALKAGLEVGIYYFSQAITKEEALAEANYVIEALKPYQDQITYPVVFDWERQNYAGSRTQKVPDSDTLAMLTNTFCEAIAQAGYEPMVYLYQALAYNNFDMRDVVQYPIWLAQYTDYPSFYYDFEMWQYTSSGRVPGIQGNVDLNLRFFRKGENETPQPPEEKPDTEEGHSLDGVIHPQEPTPPEDQPLLPPTEEGVPPTEGQPEGTPAPQEGVPPTEEPKPESGESPSSPEGTLEEPTVPSTPEVAPEGETSSPQQPTETPISS